MNDFSHSGRLVPVVDVGASAAQAARLMLESGADSLVVLAGGKPAGILTDHDLALRVVAEDADPVTTPVKRVMSQPLVSVPADASYEQVVEVMRRHGMQRLPVVEEDRLAGVVEVDDLLITLAEEFGDLAECLRRERRAEAGANEPHYYEKRGRIGWRPHLRWQS